MVCYFNAIMAVLKSSFSFFSPLSLSLICYICYSSFHSNIALNVESPTSAVSVFRMTINFLNTNVFLNNFGGGVTLIESQLNLKNNLTFRHNFADNGGGIAMFGHCLVSNNSYGVTIVGYLETFILCLASNK